ncbi:MAG TPA: hypothetical protein VIH61_03680 [Waddliaceae bacterium]
MSTQLIDGMIEEVNKKLGDRSFYTIPELVSLGLFGTVQAAREALKNGRISFIRVSERRCVIPRKCLVQYLKNNYVQTVSKNDEL